MDTKTECVCSDRKWLEIAKTRLRELESGETEGIPGDEVFKKIW
ncbi:MAG: hypothetical protein DRI57_09600 [Deltaproteobacteria bacterium]|nr:MAG: hypothetical protein DRI57_09600 [Deltaproteobacteria bacterium]